MRRFYFVVGLIALVAAGCQGTAQVRGVVVSMDGDINSVTAFELVLEDGARMQFEVDRDATFDGLPLSHLNDHLLSGDPVVVVYEEGDPPVALRVSDG